MMARSTRSPTTPAGSDPQPGGIRAPPSRSCTSSGIAVTPRLLGSPLCAECASHGNAAFPPDQRVPDTDVRHQGYRDGDEGAPERPSGRWLHHQDGEHRAGPDHSEEGAIEAAMLP